MLKGYKHMCKMYNYINMYAVFRFFPPTTLGKYFKSMSFFSSELSSKGFNLTVVILLTKTWVSYYQSWSCWVTRTLLITHCQESEWIIFLRELFFENTDLLQPKAKFEWNKWKKNSCSPLTFLGLPSTTLNSMSSLTSEFIITNADCRLFTWGLGTSWPVFICYSIAWGKL